MYEDSVSWDFCLAILVGQLRTAEISSQLFWRPVFLILVCFIHWLHIQKGADPYSRLSFPYDFPSFLRPQGSSYQS